jgi:hypothetical protein
VQPASEIPGAEITAAHRFVCPRHILQHTEDVHGIPLQMERQEFEAGTGSGTHLRDGRSDFSSWIEGTEPGGWSSAFGEALVGLGRPGLRSREGFVRAVHTRGGQ